VVRGAGAAISSFGITNNKEKEGSAAGGTTQSNANNYKIKKITGET